MERYIGTYQTFQVPSRDEAADLMGPDNLIGDRYEIDCTIENGVQKAWLVNRFGKRVGYFEPTYSRELSILKAQGMTLTALFSFVAYTERDEQGTYWGEMAVVAFDLMLTEQMDSFLKGISREMALGRRPRVNLETHAVDQILAADGAWLPKESVPLPVQEKGTAIMKSQRSITDRLVEKGREKNKGCYVMSWAFILAVIALAVFGLKACGVF